MFKKRAPLVNQLKGQRKGACLAVATRTFCFLLNSSKCNHSSLISPNQSVTSNYASAIGHIWYLQLNQERSKSNSKKRRMFAIRCASRLPLCSGSAFAPSLCSATSAPARNSSSFIWNFSNQSTNCAPANKTGNCFTTNLTSKRSYCEKMALPRVYFDMSADAEKVGRIVIEVRKEYAVTFYIRKIRKRALI